MEALGFLVVFILGLASGIGLMLVLRKFIGAGASSDSAGLEAELKMLYQAQKDSVIEIKSLQEKLAKEQQERVIAATLLQENQKNLDDQKRILRDSEERLVNVFKSLSSEALQTNNQAFLDLANQNLKSIVSEVKGEMGEKQTEMKSLLNPLEETLKRYEQAVQNIEGKREKAYGSLEEQVRSLFDSQQTLQKETAKLISALKAPHVRGQWGQISLKRVVELAGMSEFCDYQEQYSVQGEDGRLIPDMIIHLPGNKKIVIDSKVPLYAYMEAVEASDENIRKEALLRHAKHLKKHVNDLASKAYWNQFPEAPEYVILFIPGETFVNAALESERSLIEDGFNQKIIVASPSTMIAVLLAIAQIWRQEKMNANAAILADIGKQAYEKVQVFLDHVLKMRQSLEQSTVHFNKMVGSLESRVLPSLRKFKDLGATGEEDLPFLNPIESAPRAITKES